MMEFILKKSKALKLGFTVLKLPSGRLNLCHNERFIVNGFTTMCKKDGQWFKTFELYNEDDLFNKIETLDFME